MSSFRIINFSITPYSDTIASQVNSMSEDQLYYLFGRTSQPDLLTAALFAIWKLESRFYDQIISDNITSSWIYEQLSKSCPSWTMDDQITTTLPPIYRRDQFLWTQNINDLIIYPNVFVFLIDELYGGHCYTWTINRVTNIVGIRSSLYHLLNSSCQMSIPDISPLFLQSIQNWAISQINDQFSDLDRRDRYLRVLQPSEDIAQIIFNCGLTPSKLYQSDRNLGWIFQNTTIGSTPLATGLLFREKDYIINLLTPLKCSIPDYNYQLIE